MPKPHADPAEFESALSNKLKRKHQVTSSDSSLRKKKNEVVEAKALPAVSSPTTPSFPVVSTPATEVVSPLPILPANIELAPVPGSGSPSASEPFKPTEYLEALKVGFPYANLFRIVLNFKYDLTRRNF